MTSINLTPRNSFNDLPLEIRRKIWSLTLTPRILCLHIHRRLTPPFLNPGGSQLDAYYQTTCVSFTATVLPPATTPEEVFVNFANSLPPPSQANPWGSMGQMAFKLPDPGPVALYVCRESRALALEKGYELAFGGKDCCLSHRGPEEKGWSEEGNKRRVEAQDEDEANWAKRRLWEKRVWVNFTTDVMFLDGEYRAGMFSKCAPVMPIQLLSQYAPEEARNIKKLALGGIGDYGGRAMMWLCIGQPSTWRQHAPPLTGFKTLEHLFLDDSFQSSLSSGSRSKHGLDLAEFHKYIGDARESRPEWNSQVSTVRLVKGLEWQEIFA